MTREEFKKHTEKFLSVEEIARYEEDFEPAYMTLEFVDKDDFCAMLKDKNTRKLVTSFSKYVITAQFNEKNAARCFNDMIKQRDAEKARADALEKSS